MSEAIAFDAHYRKLLVLGAASHLEDLMTHLLREHAITLGEPNYEFLRRFAIDRRFSQWFKFDQDTPNYFFTMFGTNCSKSYRARLEADPRFEASSRSFMLLCATRNKLVHNNLASFTFDLTPEEIETHFTSSLDFPEQAMTIVVSGLAQT